MIAEENRLTILFALKHKTLCVCDLQTLLPLSQGALSIQLKNLVNIDLIKFEKRGKWVFYHLSPHLPLFQQTILDNLFLKISKEEKMKNFLKKLEKLNRTIENCS